MRLLDRLFGSSDASQVDAKDESIARAIVDRVVDATDKRLKQVRAYQKRLREPALATLAYARTFLHDLGEPREVSARAWSEQRDLRPLFVRPADVPAAFSADPQVRTLLTGTAASECLCVLAFELHERQVFAPALAGEVLQQEVARTAVSFSKPRVLAPAVDLDAMRMELGKRFIDYLALQALARITTERERKEALEQERALLKVRLQLAEQARRGLAALAQTTGAAPAASAEAVARDLADNERALSAYAATGLMQRFLDILAEVLAAPADYISAVPRRFALDAMNFVTLPGEAPAATLEIAELRLRERPPFAGLVARFPRADLAAPPDLLAQAEKLL